MLGRRGLLHGGHSCVHTASHQHGVFLLKPALYTFFTYVCQLAAWSLWEAELVPATKANISHFQPVPSMWFLRSVAMERPVPGSPEADGERGWVTRTWVTSGEGKGSAPVRWSCRESRSRMRRQGVGGDDDRVVTLTSSPPSKGQVTALLRLPSQLVILLRYLSVASLFQHVLGVWYSEHIVLTAGWRPHSLRGCLAKKEWKWFWNFIAKRGS